MEDANDAMAMIFEGGQYWLLGWCLVFIFSVAIMNYAGIYFLFIKIRLIRSTETFALLNDDNQHLGFAVIKSLSATTAAVLRQVLYTAYSL